MALSRTLDRVGLVLGGRYRLLSPIGTGASASVYLADDLTLRRRVAVKVLHEALAHDEAFLRRFQAEAQAAAALNHPHIMAVFDWGDTGEWPYLVTEYLGGGSLRAVLDVGPNLSLSQALIVGLETARGLDYAHRRGFVHRDIKPANLLFDEDARLRIADFGLARALAEAAWTEPMGAVLGTARYASPEQAQGAVLDGRSDVYSLALVLIEAVTGTVPFRTDTTIGTLMARVDRPLPVPPEMGSLRPVLEAAGRPDPADRIDAAAFGSLLLAAAEHLDRPRPIPLPGAALSPADLADRHPTDIAGAPADRGRRAVVPEPVDDITGIVDLRADDGAVDGGPGRDAHGGWDDDAHGGPDGDDRADGGGEDAQPFNWQEDSDLGGRRRRRAHRRDAAAPAMADDLTPASPLLALARADATEHGRRAERAGPRGLDGPPGRPRDHEPPGEPRRRRRARTGLVVVLVLAVLGGGGFSGWWYLVRIPVHPVERFIGAPVSAAEKAASTNGWTIALDPPQFAEGTAPGEVLTQSPPPGAELAEQQTIRLTVSLGPAPVPVPTDLVGRLLDDAGRSLATAELVVGDIARRFDEDTPVDTVLAVADGTPTELPKGSAVGLVVSLGPEPRTVPDDLVTRTIADATARLEALGLRVALQEEFSETVAKGVVMEVPGAGAKAEKGSAVTLVVSKGPQLVAVPDVTGMSVVDAGRELEAAGLVVSNTKGSPTKPVADTNPAAGTMVRKGSSVTITTR